MNNRYLELSPDATQKQEDFYAAWLSGKDVEFVNDEARAAYQERVTLIKDAIQMNKKPARIPICPSAGFYPIQYTGNNYYEAHYDYKILADSWTRYHVDFQPDAYYSPISIVSGKVMDMVDYKLYKWAGRGVEESKTIQYVEGEYMKGDEYQDFIDDPTGYMINVYLPRIAGALAPLKQFPSLPIQLEVPTLPAGLTIFAQPEMQAMLKTLAEAGAESVQWLGVLRKLVLGVLARGIPSMYGGFSKAPFDAIGDTMRGTMGVLMDLYKHPDELLEACEKMVPFMVKSAIPTCRANGNPLVFMPLHKGADAFMSIDQFNKFYWPTLKKVIIGLINEGLVPFLFAEGGYNKRLEVIKELPKGKVLWLFDQTDIVNAKKALGDVSCIMGNVPLSLLCTGKPEDVEAHCKKLIDTVGQDGGYIMATGAGLDGTREENVRALIDFTKSYGRG
jgi:hypothetical protein